MPFDEAVHSRDAPVTSSGSITSSKTGIRIDDAAVPPSTPSWEPNVSIDDSELARPDHHKPHNEQQYDK